MNEVTKRLRAELIAARSYYADNPVYVSALEKFVSQCMNKTIIKDNKELKIYYQFLKDYVNKGFRFSPINLATDSMTKIDNDNYMYDRCNDLIRYLKDGVRKLINKRPYEIIVTNEYRLTNNKFMKVTKPTERFNGDCINLYINKGGIIKESYLVIDNFKLWPLNNIIEPEEYKLTIPVTMIENTIRDEIIFAVDHKSKVLSELLNMYDYHYEANPNIYYNIRNRLYK